MYILILILILLFIVFVSYRLELLRYATTINKTIKDLESIDYMSKPRVPYSGKVVISLTTIPDRINDMYKTLYSLFTQTHRVDEIILNIPLVSIKGKRYEIPDWLNDLVKKNQFIVLNRCYDYGPITKILPTLNISSPDTGIICVDDDTIYRRDMVHELVSYSNKYPGNAITSTGYRTLNLNNSKPVYDKGLFFDDLKHVDVLMGTCGYLVKGSFFNVDELLRIKDVDKKYIFVDDNYISLHLKKQGIPIYSKKWMKGFSLPVFNMLYHSLACNENPPQNFQIYGDNENQILRDNGYYLTNLSFISWLFF